MGSVNKTSLVHYSYGAIKRPADLKPWKGLASTAPMFISQKMDGERMMAGSTGGGALGWNKSGAPRVIEPPIKEVLNMLPEGYLLDGEVVGDKYYVFDMLMMPDPGHEYAQSIAAEPRSLRVSRLAALFAESGQGPHFEMIKQYTPVHSTELIETMRSMGAEGVVLSLYNSKYGKGTYKHKFTNDVDCIVTDANIDSKANFELSVYDNGDLVKVGMVSALSGDGPVIQIGDVVKVNVLYATKDLHLYQPTSPKVRDDKPPEGCTINQLRDIQKSTEIQLDPTSILHTTETETD